MKQLSVALMVATAVMLVTATAAQAVPAPKATGSIVMSSPLKAIEFAAFDQAPDPDKGEVSYTNFNVVGPTSGVWVPSGTFDVSFEVDPGNICNGACVHRLTVTGFTPLSSTSLMFEGTGFYVPDPTWTETFTGTIDGANITVTLVPDDGGLKYGWTSGSLTGTIDAAGAVTGTWYDDYNGYRPGTFVIADIGYEVLHFETDISCARPGNTADKFVFGMVVPNVPGSGAAAGRSFFVKVIDNGTPGVVDVYKHALDYPAGVGDLVNCHPVGDWQMFPITAGNLTVFG